jgi:hypothetical protein
MNIKYTMADNNTQLSGVWEFGGYSYGMDQVSVTSTEYLFPVAPKVGDLKTNLITGMIEMWDGAFWIEYGKPLIDLSPKSIEPEKEDFELGGAL